MSYLSERDEQRRKVEDAHVRLDRHEQLSRIALLVALLLGAGLVVLLMTRI